MILFLRLLIVLTVLLGGTYLFLAIKFCGKFKFFQVKTHIIVSVAAVLVMVFALLGINAIKNTISTANTDTYLSILALKEARRDVAVPHLYDALGKSGYTFENTCAYAVVNLLKQDETQANHYLDLVEFEKKQSKQNQQIIKDLRELTQLDLNDPQSGKTKLKSVMTALLKVIEITPRDAARCEEYYEIEKDIFAQMYPSEQTAATGDNISEKIGAYLANYPKDSDMVLLKIGYNDFLKNHDYTVKLSTELVQDRDTLLHRALYTDLLARRLYENRMGSAVIDDSNDEAYGYYVKSKQYEKKAQEAQQKIDTEKDTKKLEKYLNQLEKYQALQKEYYDRAVCVQGERALSYLNIKIGWFGDNTGIGEIAKSKLYFAMGQTDQAKQHLLNVLNSKGKLALNSPIKQVVGNLFQMRSAVQKGQTVSDLQQMNQMSQMLVIQANSSAVPMQPGTLGYDYAEFVVECILQSKE